MRLNERLVTPRIKLYGGRQSYIVSPGVRQMSEGEAHTIVSKANVLLNTFVIITYLVI